MVGLWPSKPYTFRALWKTFGPMWLRCDLCRRYARLKLAGLLDVDSRSKTFSCSTCGGEAWLCLIEPIKELDMTDYRLDEVERPTHHAGAIVRLTGRSPRRPSRVDHAGGDLPGRKVDPRR